MPDVVLYISRSNAAGSQQAQVAAQAAAASLAVEVIHVQDLNRATLPTWLRGTPCCVHVLPQEQRVYLGAHCLAFLRGYGQTDAALPRPVRDTAAKSDPQKLVQLEMQRRGLGAKNSASQ
jgi:hypothetical protein